MLYYSKSYKFCEDISILKGLSNNEMLRFSEMEAEIEKENVIIALEQGKTLVSLLHDDTCEKLAFP